MNLLVHALGAWFATQAASGKYSRPAAVGIAMLVSRLGAPTIIMTLAGFALKEMNARGAFDELKGSSPRRQLR